MKRFFALLLSCCLLLPLLAVALPASAAAAPVLPVTLSLGFPAIKADAGDTVDLSIYSVTADDGSVMPASSITWQSSELAISDNKVAPASKGVYRLTATASEKTKTVYLLVKDHTDTEYVLFDEDFEDVTSVDQLLDAGYTVAYKSDAASISLSDGKLVLSGQSHNDCYIRLLLPAWLGYLGDYRIEVNAAMTARIKDTHWMGIMYRVQNSDYPYYQNTFRAITTAYNGTEVAERNASDAWNVIHTNSYTTDINSGSSTPAYRNFAVEAFGDRVNSIIDGTVVASDIRIPKYDRGRLGLQVRASELSVERYRVVIPAETGIIEVNDPHSDVVNAPSIITEINSASALSALAEGGVLPATAIFHVNGDGNVTTPTGDVICSLDNAMALLQNRAIPAFYVRDTKAADTLGTWLKDKGLKDAFVVSNVANLIQRVRNFATICRGVLDLSGRDLTGISAASLRAEVNNCGARVALLPSNYAARDTVTALHDLAVAVWTREAADSDVARMSAVLSGANGVVTSDPQALAACYTAYFMPSTLIASPGIIGHRGSPIHAQENTVEGALLAIELGATLIEADFYLTKDNFVVTMHDADISRTTNGSGNVSSFTYAELSAFLVDDNADVAPKPIPLLSDYCAALKGKDVRLVIEIKDGNTAICQKIVDVIDSYGMRDQVVIISFDTKILTECKTVCPELSVGWLGNLSMSYAAAESDPEKALAEILPIVQQYESTYNPKYNSIGLNLVRAANHRGVLILPWTINSKADFDKMFRYGTHAFTTDYLNWISSYIKDLKTDQKTYITNTVGGDIPLSLHAEAYNGAVTAPARATLTVVEQSGTLSLSYENGKLTTSGTGSATCLLSASFFTASGSMYSKCTELFTVTVDPHYAPPLAAGRWHLGNGAPTTPAEDDALYLDLDSGNVYAFDGTWQLTGSLKSEAPTVEIVGEFWYINGVNTGIKARGEDGKDGAAGTIDATLSIGQNGNWMIDGADTGVAATGPKGDTGATGPQGPAGKDGKDGANGLPGKKGENGANGLDGIDGKDGADGKDATADTAALESATTTATIAIVIACVLLVINITLIIFWLIRRRRHF